MSPRLDDQAVAAALDRAGILVGAALDRARRLAAQSSDRVDRVAVKLGLLAERDLASTYAALLASPLVAVEELAAATLQPLALPARFLRHARVFPLSRQDGGHEVAMADPLDDRAADAIEFVLGCPVVRRAALPADIDAVLERLFGGAGAAAMDEAYSAPGEDAETDLGRLRDLASEAPVIRLVNQMISRAVEARASDIHIEAMEGGLRVRTRIDGELHEAEPPPPAMKAAIVSRLKIMAHLDIAERRLPQDGRMRVAVRGRDIDFRVATTPSVHGESAVLRILDRGSLRLDFRALGFDAALLERFLAALNRPHGILLVTGPTGSGKTTTLYTALSTLNVPRTKILTVEDPVEYMLPGINQVQVKPQIGLTFASALRSFLRLDPDVLMVGEIRDLETARIAVQSALTGHLVLSTVHTNDAAGAVVRLLDMKVEDYLITSTVNAILGQRLVRVLCPSCREPYAADPGLLARLDLPADRAPLTLYRPVGCPACGGSGYAGRTMILELLVMSDALRRLVLRRAEAREIQAQAVAEGMQTMFAHGVAKALAGITTIEEVMRVVRDA
jgi:general secretion pathway protein E